MLANFYSSLQRRRDEAISPVRLRSWLQWRWQANENNLESRSIGLPAHLQSHSPIEHKLSWLRRTTEEGSQTRVTQFALPWAEDVIARDWILDCDCSAETASCSRLGRYCAGLYGQEKRLHVKNKSQTIIAKLYTLIYQLSTSLLFDISC